MSEFTVSDFCGVLGAAGLLVAPARDQILRWRVSWLKRQERSVDPSDERQWFFRVLSSSHENKRNSWHPIDSAATAFGAIMLGISYATT